MLCEDYSSDSDSDSVSDGHTTATTAPEHPAQQQQRRENTPAPEGTAPPQKRACVDRDSTPTHPPDTPAPCTPPARMVPPQVWKRRPNTTAVDY